jgi:hypothetical protein
MDVRRLWIPRQSWRFLVQLPGASAGGSPQQGFHGLAKHPRWFSCREDAFLFAIDKVSCAFEGGTDRNRMVVF